jgi:hypothetical protein
MSDLPTRATLFNDCLAPLGNARTSLSEVRDWLNSDWQPIGSPLTAEARQSALRAIR